MCENTQVPADADTNGADTAHNGSSDALGTYVCPNRGAPMIVIETFERGQLPRAPPPS